METKRQGDLKNPQTELVGGGGRSQKENLQEEGYIPYLFADGLQRTVKVIHRVYWTARASAGAGTSTDWF